jgi:uncharacterized protein YdhG (YjbR/CyaY superfamily)
VHHYSLKLHHDRPGAVGRRPAVTDDERGNDRAASRIRSGDGQGGAWQWLRGSLQRSARQPTKGAAGTASSGFTAEERAAMSARAKEQKAAVRRGSHAREADEEGDVLAKIAEMKEPDRAMAERLHAIVKASAPALSPRTWYGMPAYAKDRNVVCFFQSAQKFKTRYATFGFSDKAKLDDGAMWPIAFALKELTADVEARVSALVKKAVG